MRHLWKLGILNVEILRAEFDASGYDLVLCCGNVMRRDSLVWTRQSSASLRSRKRTSRTRSCTAVRSRPLHFGVASNTDTAAHHSSRMIPRRPRIWLASKDRMVGFGP
ncbi:hypothetical protein DF037_15690 [Burkholderia contaminans]|uniref:Uncharacterized protein n=1 Tax=Burkholderia contaminans TaxID=488447 RepID=A0A3N8QXV8_9BURK|nr:hypothetical protein DF037_15690 [Burkholderia contaminans]